MSSANGSLTAVVVAPSIGAVEVSVHGTDLLDREILVKVIGGKEENNCKIQVDLMVSDDEINDFFEAITSDQHFVARLIRNIPQELTLESKHVEMFQKLMENNLPKSVAAYFSLVADGDFSVFEAIRNSGCSIQMDNETSETSFEIFSTISQLVGIEFAESLFRLKGRSFDEQLQYKNSILGLPRAAVKALALCDGDSIIPTLKVMESAQMMSEIEAQVLPRIISGFGKKEYSQVEEILSKLKTIPISERDANLSDDQKDAIAELVGGNKFFKFFDKFLNSSLSFSNTSYNGKEFYLVLIAAAIVKFGSSTIVKAYEDVVEYVQSRSEYTKENADYHIRSLRIPALIVVTESIESGIGVYMSLLIEEMETEPHKWLYY